MGKITPLLLGVILLSLGETGIDGQKNIPEPKLSKFMGPTIKFLYCYSWGYQKVCKYSKCFPDWWVYVSGISAVCRHLTAEISWHQYQRRQLSSQRLQVRLSPDKTVLVNIFISRLQAAQIISICKFIVIIMVLASINPFVYFMETPAWAAWMLENKIYACMMTFFLCNAVETQLISTGAFEISLNNMPVWSKIESGRIPQPGELFQIIDNHMNMNVGQSTAGAKIGDFHDEL